MIRLLPVLLAIITTGTASWYDYSLAGIPWSKTHRTAASRNWPRGMNLKITNLKNQKSVFVLVNDYGPQVWTGRQIDLSSYAFRQIENPKLGMARVLIQPVYDYPRK